LIDGVDVNDWNLTATEVAKFPRLNKMCSCSRERWQKTSLSRTGNSTRTSRTAAKEAQAHNFIMSFPQGYDTEVGERGVTLSGGQRQRIALARAFLSNPRVLILDDSTSAIDSATEDEIQKAIMRAQEGRTTLLITHRLLTNPLADHILLLEQGS